MSIFSKLFKRNKVNTEALGLINLNSFIVYPDKSFYEEEENKRVYREFTDSYKKILSTHKTITSKDLNLNEEINVKLYTEIINKLLFELDYTVDLINNSPERNSVNIKILYLKLRHYQNEINNYKNEVFIKLKVLNELYKRHTFSKNKREAIKSEITNLEMNIVMCQNNFNALNMEINSYSSIINYSELKEVDEKKYLNSRNKILKKYMSLFNLDYKSDNSLIGIVANELVLESYLFTSKIDLRQELSDGLREFHGKKEKVTEKLEFINNIIDKYKAISKFTGKENEEFIKLVFKNKYDLIKYNYNENPVLFKDVTFYKEELEYYNDCLLKEVNTFINDRNVFKEYTYKMPLLTYGKYQKIGNIIRRIIQGDKLYDENKIILGLILSLNNPLMIRDYFSNFKVSIDYLRENGVKLFECIYTWEDEIPLVSLINLCASKSEERFITNVKSMNEDFKLILTPIFDIFKILYVLDDNCQIKLYEGIINLEVKPFSIDRFDSRLLNEFKSHLKVVCGLKLVCGAIDNKKYYKLNLPSTLKLLNTNVLDKIEDTYSTDIYVNKNLETLIVGKDKYRFIGLSSSLKRLTLEEKVNSLQISNYFNENNYNKEKLYKLLSGVFRKDKNNKLECLLNTLVFKFDDFEEIRIDFNKFISNKVHSSRDVINKVFDYIDNFYKEVLKKYEEYAYAFDLELLYPSDFILDKVRYISNNLKALGKLNENILKGDLYNKCISREFHMGKGEELINEFDKAITRCEYAVKQDYNMREIYKEICEKKYDLVKKSYKGYSDICKEALLVKYDYEYKIIKSCLINDLRDFRTKAFLTTYLNDILLEFSRDMILYLKCDNTFLKSKDDLLNSKILLELIFTIEKMYDFYANNIYAKDYSRVAKGILSVYKNNYVSSAYALTFSSGGMEFDTFVPLDTVMQLMMSNYKCKNLISDLLAKYYNLYENLNKLLVNGKNYKKGLPEGVKSFYSKHSVYFECGLLSENIVLPNSLESFNLDIFGSSISKKKIIFNDNLLLLDLTGYLYEEAIIPKSVYDLKVNYNVFRVVFKDYKDSKVLNNPDRLKEFIDSLFYSFFDDRNKVKEKNLSALMKHMIILESGEKKIYIPLFSNEILYAYNDEEIKINSLDNAIINEEYLNKIKNSIYDRIINTLNDKKLILK